MNPRYESRIIKALQRTPRALADTEMFYVLSIKAADIRDILDFMVSIGTISRSLRTTTRWNGVQDTNYYYWIPGSLVEVPGIDPADRELPPDFVPTPEQEQLLEAGKLVADELFRLNRGMLAESLGWPKQRVTVVLRPLRLANVWPYRWLYQSTMPDTVAEQRLSIARALKERKCGELIYDCEFDIAFGEAI